MENTKRPARDPFVAAIDVLGDAWTFLITREAFFGARKFQDFCDVLAISRARLSERLKHLVDAGLFEKVAYCSAPPRYEYRLTPRGRAIFPIALTLIEWGKNWRPGIPNAKLAHTRCGAPLSIEAACQHCSLAVKRNDIDWPSIRPLNAVMPDPKSVRGWRKMSSIDQVSERADPAIETLKAVGDRWSMLIMFGAQQTDFRFREAQSKLGLAHNVLSARLKLLIGGGLLERAHAGRNAAYRATDAGLGLLDVILAMQTWALDWLSPGDADWQALIHKPCGKELKINCICKSCGQTVSPLNVSY